MDVAHFKDQPVDARFGKGLHIHNIVLWICPKLWRRERE